MKSKKLMAIWMDESVAYLMESVDDKIFTTKIKSGYNHRTVIQKSIPDSMGDFLQAQSQIADYFYKISEYIVDFEKIILFGPVGSKMNCLTYFF